ncbi:hypothetical protein ACHAQH_002351 [Verticillium albo-atrum]
MFIGLGLFMTYGSYFFMQAGLKDPFMAICITSGVNILASIVIVWMSETTGRRRLATWGTTLCWTCTMLVGILGVVPKVQATNILLVLFAVFWSYIGEISTQRLRNYTAGFAAASTCVVGTGLNFLIPPMINANEWNWGLKTGFFFAGIGSIFTAALWFLVPELFERKVKPWRFRRAVTATQRLVEAEKAGASA